MEGDTITGLLGPCGTVSIHALTWRATSALAKEYSDTASFNPRSHMEGDANVKDIDKIQKGFNPRSHMEGDYNYLLKDFAEI